MTSECSAQLSKNGTKPRQLCLDLKTLKELAQKYNTDHPNDKIVIKKNVTSKVLYNQLRAKFSYCNSERCVVNSIDKQFYNENKKKFYKVERSCEWDETGNSTNKWLTNIDIENILGQYTSAAYRLIGVLPIDFAIQFPALMHQDKFSYKGKRLLFVFNLDYSFGPGTHWVAMYVSLDCKSKNYGIYYYDSYGDKPPYEIDEYAKFLKKSLFDTYTTKNNCVCEYTYNKAHHQVVGYECGMFSLHFLINMVTDAYTFAEYSALKLSDKVMKSLRDNYFIRKLNCEEYSAQHGYIVFNKPTTNSKKEEVSLNGLMRSMM
jgi:hypothetical protein